MSQWFDLHGRVAIVTGASKGLGREIAAALAQAGAEVALVSRTQVDLQIAADAIATLGVRAIPVVADVTDETSIAAMVQRVVDELGRIDILVNNAGIGDTMAVVDMKTAHWDHVMDVNMRGPMLCCKYVGPHLLRQQSGKVINIASVMATRVARYMSPYSPSKAALVQLTRTLALEWMRANVQVNALCPGYFLTDMNREFFASERGKQFIEALPARRLGKGHELHGAAVFLASRASDYVTGTTLYVDGGHSLA